MGADCAATSGLGFGRTGGGGRLFVGSLPSLPSEPGIYLLLEPSMDGYLERMFRP